MKKVILITTVFMTSLVVNAQSTAQNSQKQAETEYSFLWGIFRSEGYAKEKKITTRFEKLKFSTSVSDLPFDTTKYEQRSILWGAIQWTEKKKSFSLINPQSNGK